MIAMLVVLVLGSEPLGDKVVAFAQSQLGNRVGDGECSSLAREALREAGAKPPSGGGWGELRASLQQVQPGDILQFEDTVFVRSQVRPDGALVTLQFKYPHHTAIVEKVRKRGRKPVLVILHQNAGVEGGRDEERKVVQEWVVNLAELRSGTVKAYRPSAR